MAVDSFSQLPSSQLAEAPAPLSQISDIARPSRSRALYRPARPLPYELRQHCITFVEEELYSQAISLLLSLLTAGVDNNHHADARVLAAYVPPSQIVALAATLVVHPSMTNRARSAEQVQAANDALFYLDHLNALVGPSNANLTTAFHFSSASSSRPGRRRGRARVEASPESEDEQAKVHVALANQASLWNSADDFWQVVGWAFNCSILHQKRWERWRLWLDFMLSVLEDDLAQGFAAAELAAEQGNESASGTAMSETLLARYLTQVGESRAGKRKVMRAILADGSKKSAAEFGEIWKNETQERKAPQEQHISKRERLNFEEGNFGDYMDVDDDDDNEDDLPPFASSTKRSTKKRASSLTPMSDNENAPPRDSLSKDFGGPDSISLRQRLMALLVKMCAGYAHAFLDAEDLFDLFTEFLRPLPLSIFTQFILPSVPYLEPHSQASLNQILLRPLISSDAPTYKAVTMTQAEFETHFLPYPANYTNFVENARVSVLVESLLRLLVRYLGLQVTESLKQKLKKGVNARIEKATTGVRRKGSDREAEEELAAGLLGMSAARMNMLLATLSS